VAGRAAPECWAHHEGPSVWRGQSAAGPLQRVIQLAGAEATRAVCDEVHSQYRLPDGTIRQDNVFRYVIARTPG
jgi:hypothetical protein